MKDERVAAAGNSPEKRHPSSATGPNFLKRSGRPSSRPRIISYAQGYTLLRAAAETYGWKLNYGGIALLWRAGCIIRSVFLGRIKDAFDRDPGLTNLILDPYFKNLMKELLPAWREVAAAAIMHGIPIPSMSSGLAYFDGYTSEFLPANLLQAQRDYFGAHMYQRLDAERGKFFHTNWTERGGNTVSGTYVL